MTLQQMRYFIAVAQNLSFSKAAQQHYVSQTAVSQQIKLLEEELETELFQRTRHSVALTSAGQVFYEYAVRITDLAEDAARRTRAAAAECTSPAAAARERRWAEQCPAMNCFHSLATAVRRCTPASRRSARTRLLSGG